MTSPVLEDFVIRARAVTVSQAAAILSIRLPKRGEYTGPCPGCGGNDRFSINGAKDVFNCRQCGGGRDGIGLMARFHGLDVRDSTGFLEACSAALAEPIPEGGERESDEQRDARMARIAVLQAENERKSAEKAESQNEFRERAAQRGRGIYMNASDVSHSPQNADVVREYIRLRTGFLPHDGVFRHIRFAASHTYYAPDEIGRNSGLFDAPAMVAPFVAPDGRITGCHETWIDLANPSKYRPHRLDGKGEPLPMKKMQGSKKGSIIPLLGAFTALRWVLGEGIETVIAFAGAEGWRHDTFYGATGDLGNMAGPADPKSAFPHPDIITGNGQAKRIPGPVPLADQLPSDAVQVPDHVVELLLLADGDSEFHFTASAIARACERMVVPGRTILPIWPPEGEDFASLFSENLKETA